MVAIDSIKTLPKEISPCHYSMDISVPIKEVNSTISTIEKKYTENVRIPGFRAGKTPITLVKKRFSNKIKDEVRQELMRSGLELAISRCEKKPITMPTFLNKDLAEVKENSEFTFSIEFDVAPKVELPEYKGLNLNPQKKEIENTEVEEVISRLRKERSTYEKVERACQENDMVKVSYSTETYEPDEVLEQVRPLLFNNETWLLLSTPEILPGIKDGLKGAEAGSQVSLELTFPEDFKESFLVGKKVKYSFTVHEVHGPKIPELNDEFARLLGKENVKEIRSSIEENLRNEYEKVKLKDLQQQVYDSLLKDAEFPLPPTLLRLEKQYSARTAMEEWLRMGKSLENIEEEKDDFDKLLLETTTKRLKLQYIVSKIAEEEKIEIPESEIELQLSQIQQNMTERGSSFKKQGTDPELLKSNIRINLLMEKVSKRLIDYANFE